MRYCVAAGARGPCFRYPRFVTSSEHVRRIEDRQLTLDRAACVRGTTRPDISNGQEQAWEWRFSSPRHDQRRRSPRRGLPREVHARHRGPAARRAPTPARALPARRGDGVRQLQRALVFGIGPHRAVARFVHLHRRLSEVGHALLPERCRPPRSRRPAGGRRQAGARHPPEDTGRPGLAPDRRADRPGPVAPSRGAGGRAAAGHRHQGGGREATTPPTLFHAPWTPALRRPWTAP